MRKLTLVLAVLAFALVSKTTGAQSSVSLDPQSSGTITFSGGVLSIPGTVLGSTNSGTGGLSGATTYALGPGSATFTSTGGDTYSTSGTFGFELNGGALLKGTLTLGDAVVTGPPANLIFTFNGLLTVTSGTVCGDGPCPEYNVTLTFTLQGGTTYKLTEGTISATPEPSSMLLFCTGLLACGVFLRRRLT